MGVYNSVLKIKQIVTQQDSSDKTVLTPKVNDMYTVVDS